MKGKKNVGKMEICEWGFASVEEEFIVGTWGQ